jgi:F0F1-type ATP synthase membrane subunit b/b'
MPQALPFYFLNQGTFVLLSLAALVYIVSVFVLPPILQLIVSRVYVTKL